MSKIKKISVALAIIMVFLLQTGISFAQPTDIEGHWAQEKIMAWLEKGWAEIGEDGRFYPDAKITRGEFIAFTNKAFGFDETTHVYFTDLPKDHKYAKEVAKAVLAGYISGFNDGTVRPDDYISRLEVTTILAKIAHLPLPENSQLLTGFTDYNDIPEWGRPYVALVADIGIISGYPDGSFKPHEHISRAESIAVLDKAIEKITKPGYLVVQPDLVDSGLPGRIILSYTLGEEFSNGSVLFRLPPEIKAKEGKDKIVISRVGRENEIIQLEPANIQNEGSEVMLTGITAAKKSLLMLLLEDKTMPSPGNYEFSVLADADGVGEKLPTENEYYDTALFFSKIPLEYEGILDISPYSAKTGSKQTITLTYTFGHDFNGGCLEFSLPEELNFTIGQDKVMVGGIEKVLAEDDVSDDGQKVHVTGITAQKGEKLVMTIYDKTIPEAGPYFFYVKADADGESGEKPATLGSGREFMAFLSYTEAKDNYAIVDSFVKSMNEGNADAATALLADDIVYIDNYMDGYMYWDEGKENVRAEFIEYYINVENYNENDDSTIIKLSDNVWQVEGLSRDYTDVLINELYPDESYKGFRYVSKYFVTDDKICYVEFLWNQDDEMAWHELINGKIGIFGYENDKNEIVIQGCVPGMPADKAGLMPGDIIVAIDELYISDMKYGEDEAWLRLSGKAGTKVTLTINRNGQVFDVEVERVAGW